MSVSTASLAFSGTGPIAAATRERVLDAARVLGYAGPNPLGRQLRRGRSGIVGVIMGDVLRRAFRDPVASQVLDGLTSTLGPLGLGVLLIPGADDATQPAVNPVLESAAMDVAVQMWGGTTDDPVLDALRRRGTPTVLVEGIPQPGVAAVGIDDHGGMASLTRYLLAARELGLRVPEDVSVAGFDGLDLPWLAPDVLTSVSQPLAEKGAAIGQAVAELLEGRMPEPRVLPVGLRVGTTTGPPPTH